MLHRLVVGVGSLSVCSSFISFFANVVASALGVGCRTTATVFLVSVCGKRAIYTNDTSFVRTLHVMVI